MNKFLSFSETKLVLVYLVILFSCPKICNANARDQNEGSAEIRTTTENHLTTYFRHEPYGPKTYAFGFEVNDNKTGNRQFRDERRFANGTIEGSYGYLRPDGRISITHFMADAERGYLSQTRTLQRGDQDSKDWRINFWSDRRSPDHGVALANHTADSKSAKQESNAIDAAIDHIDLERDLLNPTLMNILNGNLSMADVNENAKQPEPKTFHNIIPEQFPIVPFALPQKVLQNLKSSEMETTSEKEGTADHSKEQDVATMSMGSTTTEKDWISSLVKKNRKEFLEN